MILYDLVFIAETAAGVAAGLALFVGCGMLIDKYWRW